MNDVNLIHNDYNFSLTKMRMVFKLKKKHKSNPFVILLNIFTLVLEKN